MRALIIFTTLLAFSLSAAAAAAERYPYQSCFEIAAEMHGVPVDLLLAVAATESGWDADARSNKNSHGIMQIQWPGTAKDLGAKRVSELYNPCFNIELGARYLKQLLHGSGGNVERALAAYNYGPGRISRSPTLPEGAKNYARKVTSQQIKINNQSSDRAGFCKGSSAFGRRYRCGRCCGCCCWKGMAQYRSNCQGKSAYQSRGNSGSAA